MTIDFHELQFEETLLILVDHGVLCLSTATSEERNPTWLEGMYRFCPFHINIWNEAFLQCNHFGNRSVSHCIFVIAWSISWHCLFTRAGKNVTFFYARSWNCESRWRLSNYILPSKIITKRSQNAPAKSFNE